MNSQLCHWSHAGPTRTESLHLASHSLSHPHTHTLSLSLSQQQWDNNHVYHPLVCSFARSLFRSMAWVLFSFSSLFELRCRVPLHYIVLFQAMAFKGSYFMNGHFSSPSMFDHSFSEFYFILFHNVASTCFVYDTSYLLLPTPTLCQLVSRA